MLKNIFLLLTALLIVSGETLSQKGVEVLSPTPTANIFTDVLVIDKTTAFAAATLGTVLKTTDAGLTWQTLKTGEDIWYNSISVVGNDHIWVTGPNEFLVSSHDGGKTWKSEKIGKIAYFYKVQFFDAKNGIVAGAAILSENQTEAIYQMYMTSDGGKTWKLQNSSLGFFPMEMYFTSEKEGYAIVKTDEKTGKDRFVKTVDGGKTWKDVKEFAGATLSTMSFPDAKNGFVVTEVAKVTAGTPAAKLVVFNTVDGGKTWKQSDFPAEVAANQYKEAHVVYFKTPKTGWVIKANEVEGPMQNQVFRTDDGGKTWTKIYTSDDTGVNKIAYFDENTGVLMPGSWFMEPKIFRTTDGGKTFAQLVKGKEYHFNSFYFLDAKTGYASGENSLIKTTDGGENWIILKKVEGMMFDGIKFFNSKEGVATGYDETGYVHLYSTTDGGENWTSMKLNYETFLVGLSFIDLKTIYAYTMGEKSRSVVRSDDGGKTWKEVQIDTSPEGQFFDLFFLDKNNGWVSGVNLLPGATKNNGMVSFLRNTTDGGATWSDTWLDDQGYPVNIQFIDKNHGWYTSTLNDTSNVIWRTSDGGKKWESSILSNTHDITEGIIFQDPLNGWLLKAYGAPLSPSFIYRTKDGGKTWTLFNIVNKIDQLQFIDSKTAFGGGWFNLMKFTID
ncbi:hypothetical protein MASR2M39_28840 [Ignavibacteriales bacterium]